MPTATAKVGRYEILGELGRGGMGVVYRANDPVIGRVVAVKTIRLSEEGTGISHEELVERFQTEARAAGRLTHPNIVVVYDAGEENGLYYITMELLEGKSLQAVLGAGHKLNVQRVIPIMEQICAALEFAHNRGVVHRDIKPANIMLSREDVVKVTDFGTAKIMQYGKPQQTNAIGTPGYMAPEQIKGKAIDGRADIFALGVMLYEMTTGQRPFRGEDVATVLYKILNEEPPPPHRLESAIPLGVSSAIMKALSKSPLMRYESCGELLEDLKNYRPGEVIAKPKAETPLFQTMTPPAAAAPRERGNLKAEMPKIPGVEAKPTEQKAKAEPPVTKAKGRSVDKAAAKLHEEVAKIPGLYEGPAPKKTSDSAKPLLKWGAIILGLALVGNYAVKTFLKGGSAPDSTPSQSEAAPSSTDAADSAESANAPRASRSDPVVATTSELSEPWASKRFFYRGGSASSSYVPALIVRLPGPAESGNSYWAFSLEAPFSRCKVEYMTDLEKLANEYNVFARHPMVVNPCSHSVFDPTQMKELPGRVLVRGAIIQGYDARPPYGIEVKVNGNRILATAME